MDNEIKKDENKANLFTALSAVVDDLSSVRKDGDSYSGKYATMSAILEIVNPALRAHGLSICHTVERVNDRECLKSLLCHSSGEYIVSRIPLILNKNDMQGLGSAITYARRYATQSLLNLAIADHDDDGDSNTVKNSKNKKQNATAKYTTRSIPKPKLINKSQLKEIETTLCDDDELLHKILKWLKIEELSQLPASRYESCVNWILNQHMANEEALHG